jgi:multiple sugar transport system substrate-binding protein
MTRTSAKARSRRDFLKLAATATALGPFFAIPSRALETQRTLKIAKWCHFLPEFDTWFDSMAKEWGNRHDTQVMVDSIPVEQIWAQAKTEVKAGAGHDVFMFPWPPAEFQQHAIDHREIYDQVSLKYGSIPQIAYKSTINPKTKKHFAFTDFWIPSPLIYFEDYWREVGMPLGPGSYDSLHSGGQRLRTKLGIPCGLSLAPTLEGNISSHTLLYAFRSQILDPSGAVIINKTAFTRNALNFAKGLNQDAGTPEELTWGPGANAQAMLARKTSCTINDISLLRTAEKQSPDLAKKISLQPPLLGPYGVTAFPHATNCSTVWNFSKNQESAKQFLEDLVDTSRTGYEKSLGCNFPAYPKTVPNLAVRLEKDSQADPPYKYFALKDALHWTPNLGSPGFASPAWMETFNTSVIPRMFASVIKGQLSPADAAKAAEAEVNQIAEKWKNV